MMFRTSRFLLCAVTIAAFCISTAHKVQAGPPPQPAASPSASAAASSPSTPAAPTASTSSASGLSIESTLLTYEGLQAASDSIADVIVSQVAPPPAPGSN